MSQAFGIYVHIPFCIQRCGYCDFATYARDQIAPNSEYLQSLHHEIKSRHHLFNFSELNTIYFGGGTPSLLSADETGAIIELIESLFHFHNDIEITLEVNPATLGEDKCKRLKDSGVNRLSIGCQSFQDRFLQICGREHTVKDTLQTLDLVEKHFDNYSLDLLYALPEQDEKDLAHDLEMIKAISPPHVSAYCLTLQPNHPMNKGRAPDHEQALMIQQVDESLRAQGLQPYELSNYSQPGKESRHNLLYWQDENYWGVGLSAHSYLNQPNWGFRFWNPSTHSAYIQRMAKLPSGGTLEEHYTKKELEALKSWESLTDFCYTQMRLHRGLNMKTLGNKFPVSFKKTVQPRLDALIKKGWVTAHDSSFALTLEGRLLSNQVFSELLFAAEDIDNRP